MKVACSISSDFTKDTFGEDMATQLLQFKNELKGVCESLARSDGTEGPIALCTSALTKQMWTPGWPCVILMDLLRQLPLCHCMMSELHSCVPPPCIQICRASAEASIQLSGQLLQADNIRFQRAFVNEGLVKRAKTLRASWKAASELAGEVRGGGRLTHVYALILRPSDPSRAWTRLEILSCCCSV